MNYNAGRGRFQRANNDISRHRRLGSLLDQAESKLMEIAELTSTLRPRLHPTNRIAVRLLVDLATIRRNMDDDLFRADKEVLDLVPELELKQIYYPGGRPQSELEPPLPQMFRNS